MTEYVIRKADEFHGIAFTVLEDGIVPLSKKTRAEYETDEYEILSTDEFVKKVNAFFDQVCGKWKEITEERYDEMLNILPPLKWTRGGFYVSEAYTLDIYSFYQRYQGHYYHALFRITTPRGKILESLREYINTQKEEKDG
jgi:hypothetical protein